MKRDLEAEIEKLHKLNMLFEESNTVAKIGVWEVDLKQKTIFWSATTKKIHGVSEDYAPTLHEAFQFFKEGESQKAMLQHYEEAVQLGKSYDIEVQIVKKDGTTVWTRAKGSPEFNNNCCIRVFGTFQDIQDQKEKETALLTSQKELLDIAGKFKGIFQSTFQFIGFLTPDGTLTEANDSALAFAGLQPEEVIGKKFWDCYWWTISKKTQEQLKKSIEKAAKGEFIQYEVEILGAKGATTTILFNLKPLFNEQNEVFSIIPEGRLIQDIVDTRKELISKNQELSQFTTIVSHDLKEPLRMVSQFMTKLNQKYAGILDEKAKQYIFYAVDGAKRMSKMIDELLSYSKIAETQKEITLIHTNALIHDILDSMHQKIEEKSIQVKTENLPDIYGNETGIKILFTNMLNNAIKYTSSAQEPIIHISCETEPAAWKFCIADNGEGIDPDYHQRIFQLFYRINKRENEEGNGVGLATCKKIVDLHKGNIWVDSAAQKGSQFYFTIKKNIHA
ncbi:PAS domain-containing sensor histidine kinase [Sediminibacterium sp. TEGAF015]|uniref:PAS domain-containing sensor histidine kinase n=1 Tax=Sediminibacterium sp. TEGAF015 TaxID=575378 RepID=UPI00220684FF|nr:PAS domain-containing sensor histidine kinase [Sediminibacterium sp. TEGAF015]BDQ13217.1 hypothetical protein TEGAF0_24340 [Sediminibacterium sp. TEGAF015]